MIGLDAADADLVERWSDDGTLPNLARLRARGSYGRLSGPDDVSLGPPWPSFYTGTPTSVHGLYTYVIWSPDRMTEIRPDPEVIPLEPFWRGFAPGGPRVVAMDVPLVYAPRPFHGVEVTGWGTHEHLGPTASHPPDLARRIEARFGRSPLPPEVHAQVELHRLLEERDLLVDGTRRAEAAATHLLRTEPWDLGIVCFSATHRAGHKLWSEAGSTGRATTEERSAFRGALRDVYVAVDRAVGSVMELADPSTTLVVFSLHGMGPNCSLVGVLPQMVAQVLDGDGAAQRASTWLDTLRRAVPRRWRDRVKRNLPVPVQDRMASFWRTTRLDWSRTRAFCLAGDLHGFIRLNVRGREARGIVEPGAEYENLCVRLADGLRTFVDGETDRPVVSRVLRRDEIHPSNQEAADLPDLTVVWTDRPASERGHIRSDRFGSVHWPVPGGYPDGRSGNHRPEGFVVMRGPGFGPGALSADVTLLDLAPTVLDLLGLAPQSRMSGRILRPAGLDRS